MTIAHVSALDSGFELRMNASSVGLTAVRVATAAARRRSGANLTGRDQKAIQTVIDDLRSEIRVLRGESSPDVEDEKSYAFANFALTALGAPKSSTPPDEAAAAEELEQIVSTLEQLQLEQSDDGELRDLEELFLRASEVVSDQLGSSGEVLSGAQASVVRR